MPKPRGLTPNDRRAVQGNGFADAPNHLAAFTQTFDFELDGFQLDACNALLAGRSVLLAAPTGAGKTIVGEFAVYLALSRGHKAFYTTPIKALSNQKYQELSRKYGGENVGLLTGDTSINSEAPVVVMTTEVLRNMLYADSDTLMGLAFVVMDEVHYLADRLRGPVWEEVIIHLPSEVSVVALSATVSNAEEFGAWLGTVRGDTAVVVSEHRPIKLWQHVMINKQVIDLFASNQSFDEVAAELDKNPLEASGDQSQDRFKVNPQLLKLAHGESSGRHHGGQSVRSGRSSRPGRRDHRGAEQSRKQHGGNQPPLDNFAPGMLRRASRPQVIRVLESLDLLPAITFIFSRAGCDAAVEQCAAAGLWLTTPGERDEIGRRVDAACAELPESDREILGYRGWRDGLLRGLAAHHAAMLPSFKEVVEGLFADGLVKAVFATETLALGINMPARTVVLEKLEKFNGEAHVGITAGEYTQLTGRAGRRGIDIEGHAVVLWQPGTDPTAVAGLASRRSYPLKSSFRPTYNMSINLLAQFGPKRSRDILESSFAQFQADSSVVDLARQLRSAQQSLLGYEQSMTCHLGNFAEYAKLRRELSDHESGASKAKAKQHQALLGKSLATLRRGDVIEVPFGRTPGPAVVLVADPHSFNPRPTILGESRELRRSSIHDFQTPAQVLAHVRIGKGFNAKVPKDRKNLLAAMRAVLDEGDGERGQSQPSRRENFTHVQTIHNQSDAIEALRQALRAHPCHDCSDREEHARWSTRWWKLRREADSLALTISQRTNTIAKSFDRVTDLLFGYGFLVTDDAGNFRPSADGQRLRRVYGEKDLLIALALREDVFGDLDAPELASIATAAVFAAKREGHGVREQMPSVSMESAVEKMVRLWSALQSAEESHHLPLTGEPDLGLVWPMFKWAQGRTLQECLRGTDVAPGDFVRWTKQVIDLLDQLAQVPGMPLNFSRLCTSAIVLIRRGVVAYTTVLE